MIGAGGMARGWIHAFWPNFFDRVEIVALVDVVQAVLDEQGDFLNVPKAARFNDMHEAFDKVEADFCTIVIPPDYHREAAVGAATRGLDILSEKPIADTWEDSLAIYDAATAAGIKMQVIQNYRATSRIETVKKVIADGRIGRPHYMSLRYSADYRIRGSWGSFRHAMDHSLTVDGSVHHFDQIRNVTGADCLSISGWDWNPDHASFDGECCASFTMRLTNGIFAHYEGNNIEAGEQHPWYTELHRVEGDEGSVVLGADHRVRLMTRAEGSGLRTEEMAPVPAKWESHNGMIYQFLEWLDGGPAPPTVLEDNIKSLAMVFGAVEASENNRTVDVSEKVSEALSRRGG